MRILSLGIKRKYRLIPDNLRRRGGEKRVSKKNAATMFLAVLGVTSMAFYMLSTTSTPLVRNGSNNSLAISNSNVPSLIPAQPELTDFGQPAVEMDSSASTNWDNRLIIDRIGVNIRVLEGQNEDVLANGAWRSPWSSAPNAGGNTVIFGHRYRYLPPNPETFFLLDKIVVGDIFKVVWQGTDYSYRVIETKVVAPNEVSSLYQTDKPVITLITCTPVYTMQSRLIVRAELIN